jgi:O-antigen ligase
MSGDASLAERAILFDGGIAGIIEHPFQGDYLGQVRDFGATGYYIHDILSMWQQFGLLGFAIYTYLIFMTAKIGYNCLKYRRFDPHSEALIYLSVASLIGVLTTKSIFWPVPALAWGLAARALSTQAQVKAGSQLMLRHLNPTRKAATYISNGVLPNGQRDQSLVEGVITAHP